MTPTPDTSSFSTGHVGLNVTDLERSQRFYQELFGFRVIAESRREGRRFAFLGAGEHIVLTLWQQSGQAFDRGRAGLHHLSFQVPSIADVQAAERKAKALGARLLYDGIVPHAEGADSGGIYFEDPDGIRLEVFTPSGAAGAAQAKASDGPACGLF